MDIELEDNKQFISNIPRKYVGQIRSKVPIDWSGGGGKQSYFRSKINIVDKNKITMYFKGGRIYSYTYRDLLQDLFSKRLKFIIFNIHYHFVEGRLSDKYQIFNI